MKQVNIDPLDQTLPLHSGRRVSIWATETKQGRRMVAKAARRQAKRERADAAAAGEDVVFLPTSAPRPPRSAPAQSA